MCVLCAVVAFVIFVSKRSMLCVVYVFVMFDDVVCGCHFRLVSGACLCFVFLCVCLCLCVFVDLC